MSGLSDNPEKKARQLANLRPRKQGDPALPGAGRPKMRPLTEACQAILERTVKGDPQGRTYAEAIAAALAEKALKGDLRAFAELADRAEGRVAQAENAADQRREAEELAKGKSFAEIVAKSRAAVRRLQEPLKFNANGDS